MNRCAKVFAGVAGFIMAVSLVTGVSHAQGGDSTNYIDMSLDDLMNVKVTVASKSEESVSDAPGVISVVTQDELKRFGGTTLLDIIARVPSFLKSLIYQTDHSVISPRGDQILPASSHVLLLINGRPMREILEGGIKSEVLESFPISIIERLEVIRGPGSVLYGSQAFSAVINVVTKSPENKTATVSGMVGEGLRSNIQTDLQYKLGDLGVVLAARYADKGGWKTNWDAPVEPFGAPRSGAYYRNHIEIPDYGPGFFGQLSFKDFHLMSSYNAWANQYYTADYQFLKLGIDTVTGQMTENPALNVTARHTWWKFFNDLGWSHKFSDKYNASANITYTHSGLRTHNWPMNKRNSYEILGEVTNNYSPIKDLNILFGGVYGIISGREGDADKWDEMVYNKGHVENTFSGYLQADFRQKWYKLIGGIQVNKVRASDTLDKVDDFPADVNPRAGLILYPLEHINIKALYSTAYRAPGLAELYMDFVGIRGKLARPQAWDVADMPKYLADHDLEPEKVNTFDLGANYQGTNVEFGINGYYSKMKNLIIQDRYNWAVTTWDNLGAISIFGLECEGKYYITKPLLFEGSFLFQQSKDDKTQELNVTPIPNFSAKAGLSYMANDLTLSLFNTFRQGLDKKFGSYLNATSTNKQPTYVNLCDVHMKYNFSRFIKNKTLKDLSLVVQIDNLLDEEMWLPAWGNAMGNTAPCILGRTIYGGFKVAF